MKNLERSHQTQIIIKMESILIFLGIYIIGFIITLFFFTKYGERVGCGGYDDPKTYASMDDYSSNASAWLSFSITWPVMWIMGILGGIYKLLKMFTQYLIDINK